MRMYLQLVSLALIGAATFAMAADDTTERVISLGKPANQWIEGLPLGNGVSAAMVWGDPSKLVLSLNHVDFWRDHLEKDTGDYSEHLREAQRLMLAGKAREAETYYAGKVNKKTLMVMPRQKKAFPFLTGYTNSFQPIGNLFLELEGQGPVSD